MTFGQRQVDGVASGGVLVLLVMGAASGADGSRRRPATVVPERRLPAVAVVGRWRIEEGHRVDGTGSSVEAAAEGAHESAPVLFA